MRRSNDWPLTAGAAAPVAGVSKTKRDPGAQRTLDRAATSPADPKTINRKYWPEDDYLKPLRMEFSRLRWNWQSLPSGAG